MLTPLERLSGLAELLAPPRNHRRRPVSRSRALLVTRLHGSWPSQCARCGRPMRMLAVILDPAVIRKILRHL